MVVLEVFADVPNKLVDLSHLNKTIEVIRVEGGIYLKWHQSRRNKIEEEIACVAHFRFPQ